MNEHPYLVTDPRNPAANPLPVFFEEEAVPNKKLSQEQGTPIYDNIVVARVVTPGFNKSDVKYEVYRKRADGTEKFSEQHRFGEAFKKWQSNHAAPESGTPLDQVPYLNKAQVMMLRHQNVFTEQQLAELSDSALDHVGMGARELRAQAIARLDGGNKSALVTRQAAEIEDLKGDIAELREMLKQATAQTQGFTKKRGRPRKDENEDVAA